MRICILCYRANPYSGGQGIYLKQIAEGLARLGHEVHAVVGPPLPFPMKNVTVHVIENQGYYGKSIRENAAAYGFSLLRPLDFYELLSTRFGSFTEISTFSIRSFFLVRSLHEKFPFDVIHDNQSLGYGLLLFKTLGVPVTATIHHPLTLDLKHLLPWIPSFVRKMKACMFYPVVMQAIVARRISGIVTVSQASREEIIKNFGVRGDLITIIHNGIDTRSFRPMKMKKNSGQIIFVGNCDDANKGFLTVLGALAKLPPSIRLLAVDGGSGRRAIVGDAVKRLGLESRITFTGKVAVDAVARYYNQSVVAVCPSRFEGFGFPAGEAMACMVPVIVSDRGALPEVVGDAGFIIPWGDDQALAHAILRLMNDPALRQNYGKTARKRIEELFSWDKAATMMEQFFLAHKA